MLSPTIFIIMFNDLIQKVKDEGYKVFAYADDVAVIGYGRRALKKLIKICETWTEENNMKINQKKSGIIWHKRKQGRKMKETEINAYLIKSSYKYLGIIIDQSLDGKE